MKKFTRASIYALFASCIFWHSIAGAAPEEIFSGIWKNVEHGKESSKPLSSLEIRLTETSDGTIIGSYCYITQSGNRIDCDAAGGQNIAGHVDGDGRGATVDFYSFFGAKGGVANLKLKGNSLTWSASRIPTGDFFYGPYMATLTKEPPNPHEGERQVVAAKAYLYPEPVKTKGSMYVVKGEYVKLIEISANLRFWKISYSVKDGKEIQRWIACPAISFCP